MNYSYFVGLDVGKKSFDASLMSWQEKELSHGSFANTASGIHSLIAWVNSHVPSGCGILLCAENMGSYVTALCLFSHQLQFTLALECPLTIKKSIGLQRGKMPAESLPMQYYIIENSGFMNYRIKSWFN